MVMRPDWISMADTAQRTDIPVEKLRAMIRNGLMGPQGDDWKVESLNSGAIKVQTVFSEAAIPKIRTVVEKNPQYARKRRSKISGVRGPEQISVVDAINALLSHVGIREIVEERLTRPEEELTRPKEDRNWVLASRVSEFIEKNGQNQKWFSGLSGISAQALSKWMSHVRALPVKDLERIEKIVGRA